MAAAAMGIALVLASGSCGSGGTDNNGGDAVDFQEQLQDAMQNNLPGFNVALQHLALAVGGTAQSDVTLTPITNGVQGSVTLSVSGNPNDLTTVNGKLVYQNPGQGLAGGASFSLTSIQNGAPQTASGSATLTQTGPAVLQISNGKFDTHTDTRGNDLSVSQANLTLDASGALLKITGPAKFTFNGLSGNLLFQQAAATGFSIEVSGNGFSTFTVP
jgi:hypothetical protein